MTLQVKKTVHSTHSVSDSTQQSIIVDYTRYNVLLYCIVLGVIIGLPR